MRGKKGQIYLIAALIIVGILIGFVAVSNYSKTQGSVDVYDMGEELGIEGEHVLTHGIVKFGNSLQNVENFTELYAEYAGEGKSLYFIYGNSSRVTIAKYEDVVFGEVGVSLEDSDPTISIRGKKVVRNKTATTVVAEDGKEILRVVVRGGQNYDFELEQGDNFYFVIAQEIGGEHHVVKSYE